MTYHIVDFKLQGFPLLAFLFVGFSFFNAKGFSSNKQLLHFAVHFLVIVFDLFRDRFVLFSVGYGVDPSGNYYNCNRCKACYQSRDYCVAHKTILNVVSEMFQTYLSVP